MDTSIVVLSDEKIKKVGFQYTSSLWRAENAINPQISVFTQYPMFPDCQFKMLSTASGMSVM